MPGSNLTLIHYLGDETAATAIPHGNSKHHERGYTRSCPSVLRTLDSKCVLNSTAKVYRSEITKIPPATHIVVLQPRNSKQVENIRFQQLEKQQISHDAPYNLHELATDIPDFVHMIQTHPDLVCIVGQKKILQELDQVLLLDSQSSQLLSYDTTFQLGDFYVSTLCFRHTLFKEAPVIPAAFLIHERKFQTNHEELFNVCSKCVQSLKTTTQGGR